MRSMGLKLVIPERNAKKIDPSRFWKRVKKSGACWLWIGARDKGGYGRFSSGLLAHRVSWALANGPIPANLVIMHSCDAPACVNPAHLFLGTHQDNHRDKEAKGRGSHVFGDRHGKAKLTAKIVKEARDSYRKGILMKDLAKKYGVSPSAMGYAIRGKLWKHVPEPCTKVEVTA